MSSARGQQVGRRLLQKLEEIAVTGGARVLRLETGIRQPEAIGLYRSAGFVERGPFGSYGPDPLSMFMERVIGGGAGRAQTGSSSIRDG
jgi:putative acetyltransferase